MTIETIKIKSTNEKSQGLFVIINKEDFDKDKHELFNDKPKQAPTRKPRSTNKPKVESDAKTTSEKK